MVVARGSVSSILFDRFGEARNQPPLHTLLIHAGLALFGPPGGLLSTEAAARLPFALAGAGTCLLLALSRRPFGGAAMLTGAALLAVSYVHLAQSVEARPYALLTLFALITLGATDRALDGGTGAWRWWALAVGSGLAGTASSYLMVYAVLPGIGLYATWRLLPTIRAALRGPGAGAARREMRLPLLAALALTMGALPAIPEMLAFNWTGTGQANNPLDALVKLLLYNGLSFGPSPGPVWAAGLSALVVLGAWRAWHGGTQARRGLVAVGIVGGWGLLALSFSGPSDLVAPRYWSYVAPLLCLLVGASIFQPGDKETRYASGPSRRAYLHGSMVSLAVVLALSSAPGVFAALAAQEAPPGASVRPDYRAAARLLAGVTTPGDLIALVTSPEHGRRVCAWYWETDAPLRPGVSVTDATDPVLGDLPVPKRIYWLLSDTDPTFLDAVAGSPPDGTQVVSRAERVLILREENRGGRTAADRQTALADDLGRRFPSLAPVHATAVALGSAAEARGDFEAAVTDYRRAGTDRNLGREYLANATGFLERGFPADALIDLSAARALEPASAGVHIGVADALSRIGLAAAADRERRVAALLRRR